MPDLAYASDRPPSAADAATGVGHHPLRGDRPFDGPASPARVTAQAQGEYEMKQRMFAIAGTLSSVLWFGIPFATAAKSEMKGAANGVRVVDGPSAVLTVTKASRDKNGSSTGTMTQKYRVDGAQCPITR